MIFPIDQWLQIHNMVAPALAAAGLGVAVTAYGVRHRHLAEPGSPLTLQYMADTLVLVPFDRWSTITKKALDTALRLKGNVRVLHVAQDRAQVKELWVRNVVEPVQSEGRQAPELIFLERPSKRALSPAAEYILAAEKEVADRQIIVLIPELAVRHWWQKPLHNNGNRLLKFMLSARGGNRIMVIDVPWRL